MSRNQRYLKRTGYTVLAAAEALQITPKQVRRNIRRGKLGATKLGVPYFISKSSFNAFVKARSSSS